MIVVSWVIRVVFICKFLVLNTRAITARILIHFQSIDLKSSFNTFCCALSQLIHHKAVNNLIREYLVDTFYLGIEVEIPRDLLDPLTNHRGLDDVFCSNNLS